MPEDERLAAKAHELSSRILESYCRALRPEWRDLHEKRLAGDREVTEIFLAPLRKFARAAVSALDRGATILEERIIVDADVLIANHELKCHWIKFNRWLAKSSTRSDRKHLLESLPEERRAEYIRWLRSPAERVVKPVTDRDRDAIRCAVYRLERRSVKVIESENYPDVYTRKEIRVLAERGFKLIGMRPLSRTFRGKKQQLAAMLTEDPIDSAFNA